VTPLGNELRKLREKYIASGGKLLNRRELEREVAERGIALVDGLADPHFSG
jgi:hypothetical protein